MPKDGRRSEPPSWHDAQDELEELRGCLHTEVAIVLIAIAIGVVLLMLLR